MKTISATLISFMIVFSITDRIPAQPNDIDPDRMNRDIRIMENALEELFRVDDASRFSLNLPGITIENRPGVANINGRYLPDFGIIFTIPDVSKRSYGLFSGSSSNHIQIDDGSQNTAFVFSTAINGNDNKITEEGIKARITDFLINYAPYVGQLSNDNRIMVIYGVESSTRGIVHIRSRNIEMGSRNNDRVVFKSDAEKDSMDRADIPVISMSVEKSDLEALRIGRIDESAFKNRIETVTRKHDESRNHLDLKVFANVLETELKENRGEIFRLNRKPTYLHLDNFGLMYQLDLSHSPSFFIGNVIGNIDSRPFYGDFFETLGSIRFDMGDFGFEPDSLRFQLHSDYFTEEDRKKLRKELEEARKKVEEARVQLNERLTELMEQQEEARGKVAEQQRTYREERKRKHELSQDPEAVREMLEKKIHIIKELMVDYGRMLSSLKQDHSLLITVNLPGFRDSSLPKKIDLRITKTVLDQMDRDSITRDQAIERIVETRL